jgi:hypothetical protein
LVSVLFLVAPVLLAVVSVRVQDQRASVVFDVSSERDRPDGLGPFVLLARF